MLALNLPKILEKRLCPIQIHFGNFINDDQVNDLNHIAILLEIGIQQALFDCFEALIKRIMKTGDEYSYFDCSFIIHFGVKVYAPKVEARQYIQGGFKYPMLVLEDQYLLDENHIKRYLIEDSLIEKVGLSFEEVFGYEYYGFRRSK